MNEDRIIQIQQKIGVALAHKAFELGAIRLNTTEPFQWASGYRMPIYNDNRQFLRDAKTRALIAEGFSQLIGAAEIEVDAVSGTATAGIPHAATLADALALPMSYVRSSNKGHGLQNKIEGLDTERSFHGQTIALIEDLISTGGSSINAVKAIREADGLVPCCFAIFTYGLAAAEENFSSLDPACEAVTILSYDVMITEALRIGYIDRAGHELLKSWREDPFGWGASQGFPRVEE